MLRSFKKKSIVLVLLCSLFAGVIPYAVDAMENESTQAPALTEEPCIDVRNTELLLFMSYFQAVNPLPTYPKVCSQNDAESVVSDERNED